MIQITLKDNAMWARGHSGYAPKGQDILCAAVSILMEATADALVPNQYTRAEKLRWLAQAEGFVLREICRVTGPLAALEEDAALAVEAPYDELYRHYVEAQIHYCNGEMARYNSAAANWNNGLLTYRDYVCRTTAPTQNVRALKLC